MSRAAMRATSCCRAGWPSAATPGLVRELERRDAERARHEAKTVDEARAIAQRLEAIELRFDVNAGPTGSLFGSVTATNVADRLWEQEKIRVDRRKLGLEHDQADRPLHGAGRALHRRDRRAAHRRRARGPGATARGGARGGRGGGGRGGTRRQRRPRGGSRALARLRRRRRGAGIETADEPRRPSRRPARPRPSRAGQPGARRRPLAASDDFSRRPPFRTLPAHAATGSARPLIHRAVERPLPWFSTPRPRAVDFAPNFALRAEFSSTVTSARSANICSVMPANRFSALHSPFPQRCGRRRVRFD